MELWQNLCQKSVELWHQGWTAAMGLHEQGVSRVQELLVEHIPDFDVALAKPIFNAALATVATTVLLGLVLFVRCVSRRSQKKSSPKAASHTTPKQRKHARHDNAPKPKQEEAPQETGTTTPTTKAPQETTESVKVEPAEGPAPSMVLNPGFREPLTHFAVAGGIDATKKADAARALLVVASSPQSVRVYTRLGRDAAATTTRDALAAQAVAGTPPRALDLCCTDLREVSAKRIAPRTVTAVAVAPDGAFLAVAVDEPPALCIFTMVDMLHQYADYRKRLGLSGGSSGKGSKSERDALAAARREPFEAYALATVVAPHGKGARVADVACLEGGDGAAHVVTSAEDTSVAVWDARTGALVARTKTNQLANLALAASPDSQFVAFGTRMPDATVWRWSPSAAAAAASSSSAHGSSVLAKCMLVRGHSRAVTHVAFGGPAFPWLLATASAGEGALCLRRVSPVWDRGVEPELLWRAHVPRYSTSTGSSDAGTLVAVAVSPCGRLVAAAHADRVDVLAARTGERVLCLPAPKAAGPVLACTWLGTGATPDAPRARAVLAVLCAQTLALYDVTAHLPASVSL